MGNLRDRLRNADAYDENGEFVLLTSDLVDEAADAIERLESVVAELRKRKDVVNGYVMRDEQDQLIFYLRKQVSVQQQTIEELRALLKEREEARRHGDAEYERLIREKEAVIWEKEAAILDAESRLEREVAKHTGGNDG